MDQLYDDNRIKTLQIKDLSNDYIDYISEKDMDYSVMKGKDLYGRRFIALKCFVSNQTIKELYGCVFFERYTHSTTFDCTAELKGAKLLMNPGLKNSFKLCINIINNYIEDEHTFHINIAEKPMEICDLFQYVAINFQDDMLNESERFYAPIETETETEIKPKRNRQWFWQ
jgi:hypothetical protein